MESEAAWIGSAWPMPALPAASNARLRAKGNGEGLCAGPGRRYTALRHCNADDDVKLFAVLCARAPAAPAPLCHQRAGRGGHSERG